MLPGIKGVSRARHRWSPMSRTRLNHDQRRQETRSGGALADPTAVLAPAGRLQSPGIPGARYCGTCVVAGDGLWSLAGVPAVGERGRQGTTAQLPSGSVSAMPNKFLVSFIASCAVAALSAAAPAATAQAVLAHPATSGHTPRYVFTDLGVLPPGLHSQARALNDRGQVAGLADISASEKSVFHAVLWTPARPHSTSGSMIDLGTLPGQINSVATGINPSGRVAGETYYPQDKAFIYNGTMHYLGSLHRGSPSKAFGINAAGAVVGESGTANGFDHAFLWVPGTRDGVRGRMHDLGTPPGQAISTASAINDQGTIAGSSLNAEFLGGRAFVWVPSRPHAATGTMTDLPQPRGVRQSGASAINDRVLITGTMETAGGQVHGFLFDTAMRDLGTLPGDAESFATGINSHGVVVGYSARPGRPFRAVRWAGGRITDLNRFLPAPLNAAGVVLEVAWAINDKGQIAGTALVGGHGHGFLLTPARQPGT
jgi:probable HAF family extracellular repeat protein